MSGDHGTTGSEGTLFSEGLRVLAVDDNAVCLKVLVTTLEQCRYRVTATTKAREALEMLRENPENFDIVITDVKMPDMDGFTLMEIIGLEMDIPVIMTSGADDKDMVLKGITHGARDFLLKPVRVQEIKNIWQHVVRKNLFGSAGKRPSAAGQKEKRLTEVEENSEEKEDDHQSEDGSTRKKPRLNWAPALHIKFLNAVHQLGTADEAVPKKILEIMNQPGLTRENVASHLQKYRKMLRKNAAKANNQQRDNHNNNNNNDNNSNNLAGSRNEDIRWEAINGDYINKANKNADTNGSSLMVPVENQDLLYLQQYHQMQHPQFGGGGGLPSSAPMWPGLGTPAMLPRVQNCFPAHQLQGDHHLFPSYAHPTPLPYAKFPEYPSPSYQMIPDASETLNPNFFRGSMQGVVQQQEGGVVNLNEGQAAVAAVLGRPVVNMQDPSLKVNNQIFMQHCQDNFDMHLNNYNSLDDELSVILKHV